KLLIHDDPHVYTALAHHRQYESVMLLEPPLANCDLLRPGQQSGMFARRTLGECGEVRTTTISSARRIRNSRPTSSPALQWIVKFRRPGGFSLILASAPAPESQCTHPNVF